MRTTPNNTINTDGEHARAFGALVFAAGYGGRLDRQNFQATIVPVVWRHEPDDLSPRSLSIFLLLERRGANARSCARGSG